MADIQVANTDADLSNNTLLTEENAYTITGLHTFSRSTNAPFACISGAAVVAYLDADKLDGIEATGFVKANGTVALTANWDAGAYEIRAQTLEADVSTGTAPLTIASTTKVANLNADKLDDQEGSYYLAAGNATGTLAVNRGGTGAATLTDGGVLLGSGTAAITATAVLGDGEILIGDASGDPVALDVGSSTAITVLGTVATGTWQGTAVADTYVANDLTISGGTVNNSVIGGSTAAAGSFTTLAASSTGATSIDVAGGITAGTGNVALVGTDGKINGPLSSTIIDDLSGANLTTLAAGNISSGTVATARLGSGTASSGTFLRGDSSWAVAAPDPALGVAEGRLTATTGTPVTTADVSGATSIYYTPYIGDKIALYDGSAWNHRTFTQITISLSGLTASKPYDVFAYDNSGTVTIETLVWTNTLVRATSLVHQNGVLSKSGATTRRYLGTVYINASGGQTDDTILKRYIWNYYNRISRTLRVMDTTTSWTYTTATVRQMRGSTANQVETVIGVAEVPVSLSLRIGAQNTLAAKNMWAGIGHNATTSPVATSQSSYSTSPVGYYVQTLGSGVTIYPAIGFSYFSMLEWSVASGTTTFYGNDTASTPTRSGMSGWVEG